MILVEVPSTAPLFGPDGLNTKRKLRFAGWTKASNSSRACSKASEKLDVSYDKLKAILFHGDIMALYSLKPERQSDFNPGWDR
jgi:hypothetical protein